MKFIEDLVPLKLYSSNRKIYIPIDTEDKKHGSAIYLLGQNQDSITKMMNLPYLYNPRLFTSLYINRDVNLYINSENALIEAIQDSVNDDYILEGLYHNPTEHTTFIFDNTPTSPYDKRQITEVLNDESVSTVSRKLSYRGDPIIIHIFTYPDVSSLRAKAPEMYKNSYSYTYNDTIHIIEKSKYKDKLMDGTYEMYLMHELAMLYILKINSNCNRELAEYIAGFIAGQYELNADKVNYSGIQIQGSQVIKKIVDRFGYNKLHQIILKNDFEFVANFTGKEFISTIANSFIEATLTTTERKNLSDSDYGIPELRKYPMPDESHVRAAIKLFNHVDRRHEKELASAIKRKIKQYNINVSVGNTNRFSKYYTSPKNETTIKSNIEDDYQSKPSYSITRFSRVKITPDFVDKNSKNFKSLKHIRLENSTNIIEENYDIIFENAEGYAWMDGSNIVGIVNVEDKDDGTKWIQALEINDPYKGHGLSKQIMRFAMNKGANYLSVKKSNEVAIKIYKDLGFRIYKSDDNMLFMTTDSKIKFESSIIIINDPLKHNYYYHLLPRDTDVSNGIVSLYYMNKNKDKYEDQLSKDLDNYKDLLCGRWGVYNYKNSNQLTDKETLDGIKQFRGANGDKMIYLFKFPSKTNISAIESLKTLLVDHDLYRIDLGNIPDEEVADIFFGTDKDHIDYTGWSDDLFVNFDKTDLPLFDQLDMNGQPVYNNSIFIGFAMKDGIIEPKYFEKINYIDSIDMITEAAESRFKTSKELSDWMKTNIKYKKFDKLMTPEQVYQTKQGSCHDQVVFELDALRKMGIGANAFFMIEYNTTNPGITAETHSLVYYAGGEGRGKTKCCWFENAWGSMQGIHYFDSPKELKEELIKLHKEKKWGNVSRYPELEITSFTGYKPGMNLQELVDCCIQESVKMSSIPLDKQQYYNENGYIRTENYMRFKTDSRNDLICFNEDSEEAYDSKLRKYLYSERIKTNKETLTMYNQMIEKNPWIQRTYINLKLYKRHNLFIDLSYYNNLFLKNNVYKLDRAINIYWDFLNRLLDNQTINQHYQKQTVFIPIDEEDWNTIPGTEIYDYRTNLNPISLIARMIRTNPIALKQWSNRKFLFVSKRGYFTVDFSTFELKNLIKFRSNLDKLKSKEPIVDEEENAELGIVDKATSPEALTAAVSDKIEKDLNVKIDNVSPNVIKTPSLFINQSDEMNLSNSSFNDDSNIAVYITSDISKAIGLRYIKNKRSKINISVVK